MSRFVEDIAGYAVSTLCVSSCVNDILAWIRNKRQAVPEGHCHYLACMNPHSYVVSLNDALFSGALHKADWLIPDGTGVVLASMILGGQIRERVTGSGIFLGVIENLNRTGGWSVFFLGSTEGTLTTMKERMTQDFPNVRVAGTFSPPFKAEFGPGDDEAMIQAVNDAKPDVLWVGMTAPKQEKWIYLNKDKLNVKFIGAVGAVFDYYAGKLKRAPAFVRKVGLEWLYRWIQEPRRLWRRNLISTPMFLAMVLKEWFKKNSASRTPRLGK